jgi:SAM-dependent methyltransferase
MASYTSQRTSLTRFFSEAWNLYRSQSSGVRAQVERTLTRLQELEVELKEMYGCELRDKDVIDVGAGQFLLHLRYLAKNNRAVGIDSDVIAQNLDIRNYVRMLRVNGPRRTLKTIARKLLGIDAAFSRELKAQLKVRSLPKVRVLRMDAAKLDFDDDSFDFLHALSVFQHLPAPGDAMSEMVRILRPGGIAHISFQLYTSETGCLDPRVFTKPGGEAGHWAHLRRTRDGQVQTNAYLNKLRLQEWRELFERHMAGARLTLNQTRRPDAEAEARALVASGELEQYSLEELLTHNVRVLWRKPWEKARS